MASVLSILRRVPAAAIIFLVRGYQAIVSPLLIGTCKFVPSCSEYCIEALREWGIVRGGWLTLKRLARCTPFNRHGGIDPVPKRGEGQSISKQFPDEDNT